MPYYDAAGRAQNNTRSVRIAAGQTTANISTPSDAVKGRDYVERIIVTAASTAAPGAVTLFDGTTALMVHTFVAGTMTSLVQTIDVGAVATSTVGFNVTTGTSVSCVVVGRY